MSLSIMQRSPYSWSISALILLNLMVTTSALEACSSPCGAQRLADCRNCLALHGAVKKRTDTERDGLLYLLSQGNKVPGTKTSSEDWELPDALSNMSDGKSIRTLMKLHETMKRK